MLLPTALSVLRPHAAAQRRPLVASAALGVAGVVVDLVRPWPLAVAIESVTTGAGSFGLSASGTEVAAGAAIVVLTAVSGWTEMAAVVASERAAERVGAGLRQQLFERAMTLSLRWHDRTRSGELVSRLTTDVGRLLDALVAVCATLLPDAVRLALVLTALVLLDPTLAVVAIAVLPLLLTLAVRQRRLVATAQTDARTESGRLAAVAVDLVRNVRAVQAFGRADRSADAFAIRNRQALSANIRAAETEARWAPRADVVLAVGAGLVLAIGGRQAVAGSLSAGQLIVVMSYLSALYSPIRSLSRLSGVLAKATASAARLEQVLTCDERIASRPDARPAPRTISSVRLARVRFGYHPDTPVLDGFDLEVRAGETVCLLGPSGTGKSTILHLLLRLYDVDRGAVLLDGVDVRAFDHDDLRRQMAFVPQDPWLLDASIADNIAFGSHAATRHGILRAAASAGVEEFVERLPDGFDTVVGENAVTLSGGQRRRIALARAALSTAPLVLLDEPTASLDRASADRVIAAIRRSTAGRTVVIATHDPNLAALAHRVVTLRRRSPDVAGSSITGAHNSVDRPVDVSNDDREEVRT